MTATPSLLHAVLVLAVSTVDVGGLCQTSLQNVPVTGIGSVRPLHTSSSFSFSSLPPHSTLNESNPEIGWQQPTNSSSSSDMLSNSSSSSSAVNAIETVFTNSSADGVADPNPTNSSAPTTNVTAVEEELTETLEVDQQVTVIGEVQLGELLCGSLVEAEDAPLLQFAISANETLLVNRSSYYITSGEAFTGGVARRTWMGVVIAPNQTEDEAFPRRVSMTWGEICDVETFSLEITRHHTNGDTSVVKSIPCGLSGLEICIVEVALDFLPDSAPLSVPVVFDAGGRRLGGNRPSRGGRESLDRASFSALDPLARVGGRRRNLQSGNVEIQVLVLYSDQALDMMGVSDVQMETLVSASFADVNEGFANSEIGLDVTILNQTMLPYEEGNSGSGDKLDYMRENSEVQDLRDEYGADLVLLVGELHDVCGIAYFLVNTHPSYSEYAYALVNPNCFSNLVIAHEFGHNLGCDHNREHSSGEQLYAHGYRYCSGTAMYTTIMSYSSGCTATRANYYANPDVSYLDRPTGTQTENCARAIDENMDVIANFRDKIYDGSLGERDDDGVDSPDDSGAPTSTIQHMWTFILVGAIALLQMLA